MEEGRREERNPLTARFESQVLVVPLQIPMSFLFFTPCGGGDSRVFVSQSVSFFSIDLRRVSITTWFLCFFLFLGTTGAAEKESSGTRFRSWDLWVMGPTRFLCAILLPKFRHAPNRTDHQIGQTYNCLPWSLLWEQVRNPCMSHMSPEATPKSVTCGVGSSVHALRVIQEQNREKRSH